MTINEMKALRAVSYRVDVISQMFGQHKLVVTPKGMTTKFTPMADNKRSLIFYVRHNGKSLAIQCNGHWSPEKIYWFYEKTYVLETGKEMRQKDADDLLWKLKTKGKMKMVDTSDVIATKDGEGGWNIEYQGANYHIVPFSSLESRWWVNTPVKSYWDSVGSIKEAKVLIKELATKSEQI